jgi:hypothetical protein
VVVTPRRHRGGSQSFEGASGKFEAASAYKTETSIRRLPVPNPVGQIASARSTQSRRPIRASATGSPGALGSSSLPQFDRLGPACGRIR